MTIKTRNPGIYQTLIVQLDKVARHNRQGSFRTKERYYEAMQRFCKFLSEEYRLQKLTNISGKHLTAYVIHMQERDKSASTIKTDLAAIRFFHDKMERTKYRLPSNDELAVELERRRFGGVDRTWSVREFHLFLATCLADGREDYAAVACLTWYAGLRIHECFRIDTAIAEQALREDAITIKGKGGKVRTVPINESISIELKKLLTVTARGHKLFVPDGVPTDVAIARLQQYIYQVRPQIQDKGSTRPMTHHGLRHSYAARTYQELIDGGLSPLSASLRVSQLLGHERGAIWPPSKRAVPMGNSGINHVASAQNNPGGDAMEQQTITMGQVTYELRRVFQGTRSLPELMAERIVRQIPAASVEASSSGPRLVQNVPAAQSVDGDGGHAV